jgi:hypothetical protein
VDIADVCNCFQTNFLPDLTHVYVFPSATELIPTFVHAPPALAAAFAGISGRVRKSENTDKSAIIFLFIYKA